ncbi:eukaryotic translation initiation factor 3, variant [Capsaspora owczarzaki ATCC 30864]|nr:eukaryotic translation initiation factor 3, variant [Capsaspora owczarzaki ATCC 30864]
MLRLLRAINVDYLLVGFYQSTYLGSFLNTTLIETMFDYQREIEEAVVLIYDPLRTTQGSISLKAYRLTQAFMDLFKDQGFSADSPKLNGLTHETILEEVPIQIYNTHLANALLLEWESTHADDMFERADMPTTTLLEKNLDLLIDAIDDLNAEQNKFSAYQRTLSRYQQSLSMQLQKRRQENEARIAAGEQPVSEADILSANRAPVPPSHLDTLLYTNQIGQYCKQVNQFASAAFSKLYVAERLQK